MCTKIVSRQQHQAQQLQQAHNVSRLAPHGGRLVGRIVKVKQYQDLEILLSLSQLIPMFRWESRMWVGSEACTYAAKGSSSRSSATGAKIGMSAWAYKFSSAYLFASVLQVFVGWFHGVHECSLLGQELWIPHPLEGLRMLPWIGMLVDCMVEEGFTKVRTETEYQSRCCSWL